MTLKSDLEANKDQEAATLLGLLLPKIIEYIEKSDPDSTKYEIDSLGKYHEPSSLKAEFLHENMVDGIKGDQKELSEIIDKVLKYSVNTWNPGFLDKLYASNNPIGLVSDLLLSVLNTNSHVYTVSPVLSVLENYIGRKYAALFFEDNQDTCGGLTFPGGSWSNVTSLHIARSIKFPDTKVKGNSGYNFAIYTSAHSHYSIEKAAILLGLGSSNVFKVSALKDGRIDTYALEQKIIETKSQGYTPLYINATAGTTVFGSFDPFEKIANIAKRYKTWLHVDGSWGGNVVFSEKHKQKLKGIKYADSITVNPHKMLGVPNTCSFLLLPHVLTFQKSMSLSAPYLFHGRENDDDDDVNENFDLADGTMGCGRRADSFKFYMTWLYYGSKGLAQRVDHAFDIGKYFVERISENHNFSLVFGSKDDLPPCLQVCFYYKPDAYEETDLTDVTRFISRELHKKGKYLVDFSPPPWTEGSRGEFFRVVFNSPILSDRTIDNLIAEIVASGKDYMKRDKS
ncbi:uncharacterized protein PRCAT00003055001 [Priceomyces carsonii]|uniref:uncharacterized protein n=1 Tax=Priceomyces carsonii TaxID=28549 RepID=UPI002ED8BF8A|nr:unnamed protein product [Priceomyces carsonii]